jgi:tRNA(fMet)-specific endonuclease VapC
MELRYGALLRRDGGRLWTKIQENIISQLSVLAFGLKRAVVAGEILSSLQGERAMIGLVDTLIGATALSSGLTVVSDNTKHFSRILDLPVDNWLL